MKNSVFVISLSLAAIGFILTGCGESSNSKSALVDSYGGVINIKGKANDYFTIQEINGRYCFVTPEGHGFLPLSVTHFADVAMNKPNSIFKTKYNSNWEKYSDESEKNIREWGFNSFGYHSNKEMYSRMPGMIDCFPAQISRWRPDDQFHYDDVFDTAYHKVVEMHIDNMVESAKDNKNIIGYYWTDIPEWDLEKTYNHRGTNWLLFYRELPAEAPGKYLYVSYLKQRYNNDLESFKSDYSIEAGSWEEVNAASFEHTDRKKTEVQADDEEFLRLIAREFYRVQGTRTKTKDPNRLILGERFMLGHHLDFVLEEQNPWIDAVSIQPVDIEFSGEEFDRIFTLTGKPIIICDHQVSFYTDEYPQTIWMQVPSEEESGQIYQKYLYDAFKKPYILGYTRCQYISRMQTGALKQGLLDANGNPYETLIKYTKETNVDIIRKFADGTLSE